MEVLFLLSRKGQSLAQYIIIVIIHEIIENLALIEIVLTKTVLHEIASQHVYIAFYINV